MAVFAVARGRCCPESTEPLAPPRALDVCPALDETLDRLAKAIRSGDKTHDPVSEFRKAVSCIERSQGAGAHDAKPGVCGYVGDPGGGAEPASVAYSSAVDGAESC